MTTEPNILVSEQLYDDFSRAAVNSVTVAKGKGALSSSTFGFESGFVSQRNGNNIAFHGGMLTGQVQSWADLANFTLPTDSDYAYFSMSYSTNPTSQQISVGQPGTRFHVGSSHASYMATGSLTSDAYSIVSSQFSALTQSVLQTQYSLALQTNYLGANGLQIQGSINSYSGMSTLHLNYPNSTADDAQLNFYKSLLNSQALPSGLVSMQEQYSYSPNYFSDTVEDASNFVTERCRDAVGNVLTQSSPDYGEWQAYYDSANRLRFSQNSEQETLSVAGTSGLVMYYWYDNLNRLIEVGYLPGSWNVSWFNEICANPDFVNQPEGGIPIMQRYYDVNAAGEGKLTSLGRLVEVHSWQTEVSMGVVDVNTDDVVIEAYEYDSQGNVTSTSVSMGRNNYTTQYLYDSQNRVAQIIYPDTTLVTYTYNEQGQIASVSSQGVEALYSYDVNSAIKTEQLGSNLVRNYEYANSLGQLTQISDTQGLFSQTLSYTTVSSLQPSALQFTANTETVSITDNQNVLNFASDQDFTIELWMQYTGEDIIDSAIYLVQKWGSSNCYPYVIRIFFGCNYQCLT